MTCVRRDHYPPHTEFPAEADAHLHAAGEVVVRDGRVVVINPTPCIREGA